MQAADRSTPASHNLKRLMDIMLCLFALPLLCLITLVMSLYTRIASPGPVFFRQVRIGYKGQKFHLYKFRTMHVNADTATHQAHFAQCIGNHAPLAKLDTKGDNRLIRGGWLLRASGLDELPQIFNVLKGDMSLVGPRPCIPYEYDTFFQHQKERFDALPGLTGLWQVSGKNRTTFEKMISLDVEYTKRVSFWLDVKIILLTIPALLVQIYDTKISRKFTTKSIAPQFTPSIPEGTKA